MLRCQRKRVLREFRGNTSRSARFRGLPRGKVFRSRSRPCCRDVCQCVPNCHHNSSSFGSFLVLHRIECVKCLGTIPLNVLLMVCREQTLLSNRAAKLTGVPSTVNCFLLSLPTLPLKTSPLLSPTPMRIG